MLHGWEQANHLANHLAFLIEVMLVIVSFTNPAAQLLSEYIVCSVYNCLTGTCT